MRRLLVAWFFLALTAVVAATTHSTPPSWLVVFIIAAACGLPMAMRLGDKPQPPVVDASHRDLEQDHMLARLEQRYVAMDDPDWEQYERQVDRILSGEAWREEAFMRKVDREVQKRRLTVEQARAIRQLARTEQDALLRYWGRGTGPYNAEQRERIRRAMQGRGR